MKAVKKKSNTKIKIGLFLIFMFVAIYGLFFLNWVFGRTTATEIIRIGSIEDSTNVDGFLVRSEEILKSNIGGKCLPKVLEGEKLPANSEVATVLMNSSAKLLEDLKELDLKIIKYQKGKNENQEIFSEDIMKIDSEIGQRIKLLANESNKNRLENTKQMKDNIDLLIQKKAGILGGLTTADAHINSLKKEKVELQGKIKQNTRDITTQSSGILSYVIDGYEEILTPNSIKEITPKFLKEVKLKEKSNDISERTIEAEKPFAKVIKDIECYIVVAIDSRRTQELKIDDNVNIRINDINKVVNGIIDYKSNDYDGMNILAVKIDKGISETASMRKINIDLIKSSYKGLKVPLKSLKDIDSKNMSAKIVLDKANYASIRNVKIIGKNDESAIIGNIDSTSKDGVSLYDIFIINPENVQEGQLINQ